MMTFCTSAATMTKSPLIAACPLPTGWKFRAVLMPIAGVATLPSTATVSFRANETVARSEEHTSELQSHSDLVCRLLLEKKKKANKTEVDGQHVHRISCDW